MNGKSSLPGKQAPNLNNCTQSPPHQFSSSTSSPNPISPHSGQNIITHYFNNNEGFTIDLSPYKPTQMVPETPTEPSISKLQCTIVTQPLELPPNSPHKPSSSLQAAEPESSSLSESNSITSLLADLSKPKTKESSKIKRKLSRECTAAQKGNLLPRGTNDPSERINLWTDIERHSSTLSSLPWILGGDFNTIKALSENHGGSKKTSKAMLDFKTCLHNSNLEDLNYSGIFHSWSNKSPGVCNISKKLDRVLINESWSQSFPLSHCVFLPPRILDHSPMIIKLVVAKLKNLKQPLKLKFSKNFSAIKKEIQAAKNLLSYCQIKLDAALHDIPLRNLEKQLLSSYSKLKSDEEQSYRQKLRIKWLKDGDSNTSFFFNSISSRINRNKISSITAANGEVLDTAEAIKREVVSHF
ncbi:uncharacterized protein LOC132281597 [Cornus florida]|uniref:uncharacterized protein LOC132281597 n=1 Tax=Cornus florida TaxID=4283 RepID=UPI0028A16EE0|nr:uncharacterized protein LOC132281597 [Cornus florida]